MDGIVVFLNGDRGLCALQALLAAGHGVAAVVVPPGKARVAEAVTALGPPLMVEADVNASECLERLRALRPALFLIAGYSTIFRLPLLGLPVLGTLNLHAGRVPEYRGGSPLNWQIINGEPAAGLSVLWTGEGIDDGPVVCETRLPIGPEATIATLHVDANAAFGPLTVEAVSRVEAGERGRAQDESRAVYWHQRGDQDGRLRPDLRSAVEVYDFVRALTRPYPGAWVMDETGNRVRILDVRLSGLAVRGQPGRVCRIGGQGLFLVCRDRAVLVVEAWAGSGEDGTPALRHGMIVR